MQGDSDLYVYNYCDILHKCPGKTRHETPYNYPYPKIVDPPVPQIINVRIQEHWSNVFYTEYTWRFWIVNDEWYVIEAPCEHGVLELRCYDALGNPINKWDDTTRYNVVYNSSTRRNQNKHLKKRSFKGILQFYKDCYDREQITISPKPDLPRLRMSGASTGGASKTIVGISI